MSNLLDALSVQTQIYLWGIGEPGLLFDVTLLIVPTLKSGSEIADVGPNVRPITNLKSRTSVKDLPVKTTYLV